MKTYTVLHTQIVNGVQQRFLRDEDRIQANNWEEAEDILSVRYKGNPDYTIVGELIEEIDHATVMDCLN